MDNRESKKRKKAYYVKCALNKKFKASRSLQPGMRGFLLTCNKHERESVGEAYNILNEYADNLYGPHKVLTEGDEAAAATPDDDSDEDIDAKLKRELGILKQEKKSDKRFMQVYCGANNCVFIKTDLPDPVELVHAIYTDLYATKKARARYILRFLPVSGTCRTDEDAMQKLFTKLLRPHMEDHKQTYGGVVKVRNNNSVNKTFILTCLRKAVVGINRECDVNFVTPDLVVHVDIVKTVCCVGVLKDFYKFRKYNLQEVAAETAVPSVVGEAADEEQTKEGDTANTGDTHHAHAGNHETEQASASKLEDGQHLSTEGGESSRETQVVKDVKASETAEDAECMDNSEKSELEARTKSEISGELTSDVSPESLAVDCPSLTDNEKALKDKELESVD